MGVEGWFWTCSEILVRSMAGKARPRWDEADRNLGTFYFRNMLEKACAMNI